VLLIPVSCSDASRPGETALLRAPSFDTVGFECGEDMRESTQVWSKAGKAKGCVKDDERHGRWLFWEEGYVNLEGFYRDGVKHGLWTVFHEDGSAFVRLSFEEGKVMGKKYFKVPPGVRV